jgi:hypothetical protein
MDNKLKLISALMPLIILALAWLVGTRVSTAWALRQKRRESVHSAVSTFQSLYGRWFTLAKLWNLSQHSTPRKSEISEDTTNFDERKWTLMRDVIQLEGEFEAFWLKLSAQYAMPSEACNRMERFREGFQVLRRQVVAGKSLGWFETDPEEYQAFRTLAAQIVASLSHENLVADYGQSEDTAVTSFHSVTSNRFQKDWYILDK